MSPDAPRPSGDAGSGEGASEAAPILCGRHGVELQPGKIELTYQGHTFPVDALICPVCGLAFVSEDLVRGRMREVEQTLEEK